MLPVIFRIYRGELCAYFPTERFDNRGNIACYANVGQHGVASPEFLHKGKRATPEQYGALLTELKNIYETGDDPISLKVYSRATGKAAYRF